MMRKRAKKREIQQSIKWISFGVFLLLFAVFVAVALVLRAPSDSGVFAVSSHEIKNPLGTCGVYFAEFFIQLFGLFSYPIVLCALIWGRKFIDGKIHQIKRKFITLAIFVLLGTVVFNIASTFPYLERIIKNLGVEYYAGGVVGYVLSKVIFIDIFKQAAICRWIFCAVVIVWIVVARKALFIEFGTFFGGISQLFDKIYGLFLKKTKLEPLNRSDIIWNEHREESRDFDQTSDKDDKNAENLTRRIGTAVRNFNVDGKNYTLPSIDLLDKHFEKGYKQDDGKIKATSAELLEVLEEFGVNGEILNVRQGPVVTMFEFRPAPGIKTSRVISLSDDIARSMSAISARISTIPGQNAIGIELPNKNRQTVYLRELLSSEEFYDMIAGIPIILGKDISGNPIMADLTKMPHLLVAGTTGSGKSVSVNDMVLSILFKFSPKDCKLIMIDPKMLELSVYDEIPHLLTPVVTDPKKAVFALKWAVAEMENRYRQMSKLGVRNIGGFNKKLAESKENGDLLVRKIQTGFDQDTGRPIFETQQLDFEPMPYIVVIVDEMADLMLVAGKDVEAAIQRLAQMARAAGIHIIMATQRPSVDVITGTIKANFPTRVSFQVTSKIDSRTILGEQGAEQLLGQGDMLYMSGAGRILRVHGPLVKDSEVERIVSFIKCQGEPDYVDVVSEQFDEDDFGGLSDSTGGDEMYKKAVEIILNEKKCSISYIQRRLQIGYNRAARIIEEMEEKGVISAPNHTGKRDILI
ncbi:MAG: DNA translocase FtsK 4TM domain-containing protein [Holosporales bacterium]|jgi:S-DNA-T family DNA segregation ATPase FtsK/SpoIIIE|nr:DNA translocase FtsK 4TM domain-containing protein [Holosporales bacterium]